MAIKSVTQKRKLNQINDKELKFEKMPRISKEFNSKGSKKKEKKFNSNLLPIKVASGKVLQQSVSEDEEEEEEEVEELICEAPEVQNENVSKEPALTTKDLLLKRKKNIQEAKSKISQLASDILAEPQKSLKMIKDLRLMMENRESPESYYTIKKLVTVSLACLFVDILPGYRIRERTEQEKAVKLSKEVKALTEYEDGLLHQYQQYLQSLEKMIKMRRRYGNKNPATRAQLSMSEVAVQAMCDLFKHTSHFNFHNNITVVLVPIANDDRNPKVRKICCDALEAIFLSDKLGSSILAAVKAIAKVSKERGPNKLRAEFLNTLLKLKINQVDYSLINHKKTKQEKMEAKREKKKMSRREIKQMKKQKKLKNELKEVAAAEDHDEKMALHTETIQQVFLIYFRILKHKKGDLDGSQAVLPAVLQGLAKFAHMINIDFFSDLFAVLQSLVSQQTLPLQQNVHCIFTAFTILSGQGEILNIDPVDLYKMLFSLLHEVVMNAPHLKKKNKDVTKEDLDMILMCVSIMLNKRRKQITLNSLNSFIKRLSTIAVHTEQFKHTVKILEEIQKLLNSNSKALSLFDSSSQSFGTHNPYLDDPEKNCSQASCLWEMHLLRRHYATSIKQTAFQILRKASKEQ
uniref:nucleolar complex protein 3 homolog n=1 Tax=Ciona intestinalis TaxID=7719 RepID=UPI000180D29F|nr:nucleolar complex protein 3 homolog [Ciona intestinalis]|eukprot:XP_002119269.1 nucleolar complex protein 3 homolog [Ciona intestinalis]